MEIQYLIVIHTVCYSQHWLEVEQYPLPLIEDLFAGLAGGKRFSKIDLSQAYLQMHVAEQSRKQMTINTHKGLYRYFCLLGSRLPHLCFSE